MNKLFCETGNSEAEGKNKWEEESEEMYIEGVCESKKKKEHIKKEVNSLMKRRD